MTGLAGDVSDQAGERQRPLIERIVTSPRLAQGAKAGAALAMAQARPDDERHARLAGLLAVGTKAQRLIDAVLAHSPFLARIVTAHPEWLVEALRQPPATHLDRLLETMRVAGAGAVKDEEIMPILRHARQQVALLVALADLGGVWALDEVTEALTRLADAAVALAADHVLRDAHRSGRLAVPDLARPGEGSGFVLLAMGKHGARELNYSSDVDLIALHDPATARLADDIEADAFFARVIQRVVRLLQSRTADDYVLRVDLRLRPDPSSMPPSVPLPAAYQYYESIGQNWERAAFIKARAVAGDIEIGRRFLAELAPFIWRRHLDFKAIAALRGMWRDVRAVHGDDEAITGRNVKLGPGGIRECELATQALQLVFGGREARLRGPRTLEMLKALSEAGHLPREARKRLSSAYVFLRNVEHRLQMRNDEQTQILPRRGEDLDGFARWCGFAGAKAFEREFASRTSQVRAEAEKALGGRAALPSAADANFTTQRLAGMGFRRPAEAERLIAGWTTSGQGAAPRRAKVLEALTALLPDLIGAFAATADPDAAIATFDHTFDRMAAPTELFSILAESEPLRRLFGAMLGSVPRLAEAIVQRPHLLDVFLDARALSDAQTPRAVEARIALRIGTVSSLEEKLDLLRDAGREEWFLAGARLLSGGSDAARLGSAYTAVAEASLRTALAITREAFATEHGVIPGADLAVVAMGRLGSREMTATSDLDLIIIYDRPQGVAASNGPRPLEPMLYFSRLTHRLITAISAPTSHGRLYDIDMRLRPSGGKGPVALPLSAFVAYQQGEAETWEHLALTRARPVAGEASLCRQVANAIKRILARSRDPAQLARDVLAMRELVASEKGDDDLASLKNMRGGLVDIDFCVQLLVLTHAHDHPSLITPAVGLSLDAASAKGLMAQADADRLGRARNLYTELLQRERLHSTETRPVNWNDRSILGDLAKELGYASAASLLREVEALRSEVTGVFERAVQVR